MNQCFLFISKSFLEVFKVLNLNFCDENTFRIYAPYQEILRCMTVTTYYFYIGSNRLFIIAVFMSSAAFWSVYIVFHVSAKLNRQVIRLHKEIFDWLQGHQLRVMPLYSKLKRPYFYNNYYLTSFPDRRSTLWKYGEQWYDEANFNSSSKW